MNITVPSTFSQDIASSTTHVIAGFSAPVYIILGILLALLIGEILINVLGKKQGLHTSDEL